MINEQKANWRNLNWAKGLDRLFNVLWGLFALMGVWALIETGITPTKVFMYVVLALITPKVLKLTVIWVAQGFHK